MQAWRSSCESYFNHSRVVYNGLARRQAHVVRSGFLWCFGSCIQLAHPAVLKADLLLIRRLWSADGMSVSSTHDIVPRHFPGCRYFDRVGDRYGDTFRLRLVGPIKSDAVEEIDKARIAANRIKERKHLQRLQSVGLFSVGLLKPDKCLVVIS